MPTYINIKKLTQHAKGINFILQAGPNSQAIERAKLIQLIPSHIPIFSQLKHPLSIHINPHKRLRVKRIRNYDEQRFSTRLKRSPSIDTGRG